FHVTGVQTCALPISSADTAFRLHSNMFRGHALHTFRVLIALGPFALSFLRDYRRWFWFGEPLPRTAGFHERRASRLVARIARLRSEARRVGEGGGAR